MDTAQLWARCRAGDASARVTLIERYVPLARALARRIRVATPLADSDDMVSAALLGLIDAVDRFEACRGVPFEAYAGLRIRGAMIDELRRVDERGRGADADEKPRAVSLEGLVEEEWQAFLAVSDEALEEPYERADLNSRVENAIQALPPRQREVLARYYADSLTLREAGVRMGISEARACQLHSRAISNLRRALSVRLPQHVAASAAAAA